MHSGYGTCANCAVVRKTRELHSGLCVDCHATENERPRGRVLSFTGGRQYPPTPEEWPHG
jgi:hypothetical protein